MIITINTDASFSNTHKIATFAFWISSDKGKFFRSGALKGSCFSPIHAEMKCIINSLHFVLQNNDFRFVKKIIINTDCLFAIHKFENPNSNWSENKKQTIKNELNTIKLRYKKIYNDFFSKNPNKKKINLDFRHVKAHEHTKNARHYVNDVCDKEAKIQMGLLLKKQKK